MKKITLLLTMLSILLFTACDLSSSEEKIKESDFVLIINHAPRDVCDFNRLENELIDTILPLATLEILEDSNAIVDCNVYGINAEACQTVTYSTKETNDVSCVIGADTADLFDNIETIIDLIEDLI